VELDAPVDQLHLLLGEPPLRHLGGDELPRDVEDGQNRLVLPR